MTLEQLQSVLGWCIVIHLGIFLVWFLSMALAHDWIYRVHRKWFQFSLETFDALHYGGLAFYKILVIVLNLVPYLALQIAR